MSLVIGLDLGTTNCKALALAEDGTIRASASGTYPLHAPHSGWAEQEASEVWQGVTAALQEVAGQIPAGQVAGLCLSGAMHSLLPVAANGEPLAPAMTWADQRATSQASALRSQKDPHSLYLRTGCPLQSIYYPAKLRWWFEMSPQIATQAEHFVAIKDWVLYQLTGAWATDTGLASSTGLLDIQGLKWDEAALALAGISAQRLPPLVSAFDTAGKITPEAARLTGLRAGTPVVAGTHDGGSANIGAHSFEHGETVITVGTSGAIRRVVDRPLLDNRERTWCYWLGEDRWLAGGAINNGGLALEWVREKFYAELSGEAGYKKLLEEAASIPAGAEGVWFLPYFNGERSPDWDANVRAQISGLGLERTRGHIARAAMEGVAFCLADVWAALKEHQCASRDSHRLVRLTGGITQAPAWGQIVADVLDLPLVSFEAADASASGAAMIGHQALGSATIKNLAPSLPAQLTFTPGEGQYVRYTEIHRRFQDLYQRTAPFFQQA